MDIPHSADIVIVGGGVMGASIAWHLASRGTRNLILLEKEELFGQGSTGRCAGGVRYQFGTEINIKLSLASLPMLERFKEELGQDINYRKCGYLLVLTNENDARVFKHNMELQHKLGVQTEWLSGNQVHRRLPLMNFDDAIAATFHQKDGLVDPNSVVMDMSMPRNDWVCDVSTAQR
jgi:sarcosine oxidase subunit beta